MEGREKRNKRQEERVKNKIEKRQIECNEIKGQREEENDR